MLVYHSIKETLTSPELGEYQSFGITVHNDKEHLFTVSDISTDETFVTHLAKKFTDYQLSPLHLYDILDDIL